ncbi:MAG TPA: helix-turn-helix transcriptional regulator [Streptosporangiaceae bacterium]|nr:helix-turn-helix transcriptional regulator [Streptosporangiaceae bacterium]
MATTETTGSTVPRRQLGRYLRDLRNRQHITVKTAATQLEWSEAKIWRIETGQTSLRSLDVEAMCRVYAAPADLTEALMGLAKETKAKGWWQAYGDVIPENFDVYLGLEEAASSIAWYEPELIPGLLQTADYARAVIGANASADDTDRRVQLRIERQALIRRATAPLALRVALNESVLRRPIGGREVMAEQLDALAEAAELPNVKIRVVPFTAGLHHGVMTGPFELLRFPANGDGRDSEPPTIFQDGYTGGLYLDKANEIERFSDAFEYVWTAAASEDASIRMIRQAAEDFRGRRS